MTHGRVAERGVQCLPWDFRPCRGLRLGLGHFLFNCRTSADYRISTATDNKLRKVYFAVMNMKVGRNDPCPCGKVDEHGKRKKYKHCCLSKDEKEEQKAAKVAYIRANFKRLMIRGPYKQCPQCGLPKSFGVFAPMGESGGYSRECLECGYKKGYSFPKIRKTVVYIDQFVISNLVKLLDKDHPGHAKIKADPFWNELFIRLEAARSAQAIICPDSFYHRRESVVGKTDFRLMRRLYEHFSSGKTLPDANEIDAIQMVPHFDNWLEGKKTEFDFTHARYRPKTWIVGLLVSG